MAKSIIVLHIPQATLQKDVNKTNYISKKFQILNSQLEPQSFKLLLVVCKGQLYFFAYPLANTCPSIVSSLMLKLNTIPHNNCFNSHSWKKNEHFLLQMNLTKDLVTTSFDSYTKKHQLGQKT